MHDAYKYKYIDNNNNNVQQQRKYKSFFKNVELDLPLMRSQNLNHNIRCISAWNIHINYFVHISENICAHDGGKFCLCWDCWTKIIYKRIMCATIFCPRLHLLHDEKWYHFPFFLLYCWILKINGGLDYYNKCYVIIFSIYTCSWWKNEWLKIIE